MWLLIYCKKDSAPTEHNIAAKIFSTKISLLWSDFPTLPHESFLMAISSKPLKIIRSKHNHITFNPRLINIAASTTQTIILTVKIFFYRILKKVDKVNFEKIISAITFSKVLYKSPVPFPFPPFSH